MPKILIAYDASEPAKRALQRAAGLAADGDEVAVVSVAPLVVSGPRSAGPLESGDDVEQHRQQVHEAAELLAAHGIDHVIGIPAVGHPAEAIVAAAEEGGYDLVVVGRRGHGAVHRFVMGSTSTRVVTHAPCDVLVVH